MGTWALLVLLLSLFSSLLSVHLPSQSQTGNSSIPPPVTFTEDIHNDSFTKVTTGGLYDRTEATTETETETTEEYKDSSLSTDHGNTNVTGTQQPPNQQSTAHSTPAEAETAEMNTKVTVEGSTLSWYEMSTSPVMTAVADGSTETPKPPAESTTGAGTRAESTTATGTRAESTTTTGTRAETTHPVVIAETAETSSSSTQHPEPSTTGPLGTTNATVGAVVPRVVPGGRRPVTDPAEVQTATTEENHAPADKGGGYPCGTPTTRKGGLVSQCLIAIATLAGVATIFIVSTTVLCTKLSSHKYRYRMSQAYGTEMVCISALLPDGNGTHGRPRMPKSNGALIPNLEDSEGDDLTLHSFLPETERGY